MATARNYSNTASQAATTAALASTDTSITLTNYVGYPAAPYTAALARGTANEEIVLVTGVSSSTVTVTRGYDGTSAKAQGAGTTFQEVAVALDFRDANTHVNGTSGVHGVTGSVVGTTDVQTLTNKTLTSPSSSNPTDTGTSTIATASVTTLNVSGVSTLAGLTATTGAFSGLLSANGGITVPTGKVVTLTDAPAATTSAVNKAYADALGATTATASTIVRRDAAGRTQLVDPAAAADAATKGYVDAATSGLPYGFAHQSVAQTGLASGWNVMKLQTKDLDSASSFDANGRFTVPAGQAGVYAVEGGVVYGALPVATAGLIAGIRKNGAVFVGSLGTDFIASNASAGQSTVTGRKLLNLAVGDYVELWGFANGGAWVTQTGTDGACWFAVERIR